jgi:phytoene dehydrogenase-like protein
MSVNTEENVAQTQDTKRDKVMTFSYDTSLERKYDKPTYPGTGNGMGGEDGEYDIVVIGSGVGGLACGAMSSKYGEEVIVLESHIKPGGSAHSYSRMHKGGKYTFEVGPSIFEGLDKPSLNPLRIVFDILGEKMPVETYNGIEYWTPEGYWRFPVGNDDEKAKGFKKTLREQATDPELALQQWDAFRNRLKDLCGTMSAVSLVNLRQDAGFLATTAGGANFVASHPWVLPDLPLVFKSLHELADDIVTEPFLRNWIDTMCIFCGFPAKGAMTAHILYILDRFFDDGACYSVPKGGTQEIGNTLVRGLEKHGGKLQMNCHVDQIVVENGRAVGVRLKNGKFIKARKAVVSGATPFDTVKMLGEQEGLPEGVAEWRDTLGKLPRHGAIMHLWIAIDATGLDLSNITDPAHLIVSDWTRSLQDSQNLCSFFMPSLLDPSVCPPGKHVIHVYSSGGEPYEPWEKLTPGSPEYEKYKEERGEVLWKAVERAIPDIRERAEFHIVGSPLAHEAFLRRDRGTYGMAWAAGTSAPYAGLVDKILPFPFPNLKTPVAGLLRCGDSCFPGIGTPSAAASGVIAANTLTNVDNHIEMLKEIAAKDPTYNFLDPGPLGSVYQPLVSWRTPSTELRGGHGDSVAAGAATAAAPVGKEGSA